MTARRDAIIEALQPMVKHQEVAADAILALPIEQARDRVIEAARAYDGSPDAWIELIGAVSELDALEGQ